VTDAARGWSGSRSAVRPSGAGVARPEPASLVDVLERVLDKGIVIAGDIQVNLLDIELLTIKIRLLIASVDRAREMGIDWWEHDPYLSGGGRRLAEENRQLRSRVAELESGRSEDGQRRSEDSEDSDDEDPGYG
jgi:Gas vesicle protein